MFGGAASEERIREEMLGYSDYQIHRFCLGSGSKRIARRQLPADAVRIHPAFPPPRCVNRSPLSLPETMAAEKEGSAPESRRAVSYARRWCHCSVTGRALISRPC